MRFVMRWLAAVVIASVGCSQTALHATTGELKGHAAELRTDGRANVAIVEGGTHTVAATDSVDVTFLETESGDPYGGGRVVTKAMPVGELVAGCDGQAGDCLVDQVSEPDLVVGMRRAFDKKLAGQTGSAVILGAALTFCAFECSGKVMLGLGALAVLVLASVLFLH
jgi:hypothetical protein